MFSYDEIKKYNETELFIYKYIISNIEKIPYMTIRELAKELYVSTSTLLRFCNKNGYESYSEFKEAIKKEKNFFKKPSPLHLNEVQELISFFQRIDTEDFENKISDAVEIIKNSDYLVFIGNGSSGTLAKYGARLFSNMGKFAVGLEDTFYPVETYDYKNTAVVAVSESGETEELINIIQRFKEKKCKVLGITNSSANTLAKLCDWNFFYNFKEERVNGNYNATTQVPALFILEVIAGRI